MDAPNRTPWDRNPTNIIIAGMPVISDFPPQIIGIGSKIYCFYIQRSQAGSDGIFPPNNAGLLSYCVLSRSGPTDAWVGTSGLSSIRIPLVYGRRLELASDTPSLAYFEGSIHIVYPDELKDLVHIQLNLRTGAFRDRREIGIKSFVPPALVAFRGALHCLTVTTLLATGDDKRVLVAKTWDRESGWQKYSRPFELAQTTSPIALFELQGSLHLYFVQENVPSGDAMKIWHYKYDGKSGSDWEYYQTTSSRFLDGSGISGCSVIGNGYLAYRQPVLVEGQSRVYIVQLPAQTLDAGVPDPPTHRTIDLPVANYPLKTFPTVPQLTTVGNTMMCIWSSYPQGVLQYTTRKILPLPRLSSWMTDLPDQRLVSDLTLPGSHDSASDSILPLIGTQNLQISNQLRSGVRYFDLRAGFPYNPFLNTKENWFSDLDGLNTTQLAEKLIAYHNFAPIFGQAVLSFVPISKIFQACYEFLDDNPGECIFLQIKQDWPAPDPNPSNSKPIDTWFAQAIMKLIEGAKPSATGATRWRRDATLPTIGEVRGKIQLVRRFGCITAPKDKGINVYEGWPDNGNGIITSRKGLPGEFSIEVQDHWQWGEEPALIAKKFAAVKDFMDQKVRENIERDWYINYASAVGLKAWPPTISTAPNVAVGWAYGLLEVEGVNEKLAAYFNDAAPKWGFGTIILDFCDTPEELLLGMIRTNFMEIQGALV